MDTRERRLRDLDAELEALAPSDVVARGIASAHLVGRPDLDAVDGELAALAAGVTLATGVARSETTAPSVRAGASTTADEPATPSESTLDADALFEDLSRLSAISPELIEAAAAAAPATATDDDVLDLAALLEGDLDDPDVAPSDTDRPSAVELDVSFDAADDEAASLELVLDDD